jgi:hypothetical protein
MVTLDREKERVMAESIGFLARLPRMDARPHLRLVASGGAA